MIRERPHSMPGPDGIPHAAGKCPDASSIWYPCHLSLFTNDTHSLPDDMKLSLLVFLPKGSDPPDRPGGALSRTPVATRPLSMSNTDVKTLAAAFIRPMISASED
eukprot:1740356-Pyramimonas_sp.AAC.1